MRYSTILIALLVIFCVCEEEFITSCDKLRIGTKEDATDVMLDGEPTWSYKQYRHIKNEDDVEYTNEQNQATFYIHGISLENEIGVSDSISENQLLSASRNVENTGDGNKKFTMKMDFKCTNGLTGVSDVYLTFTLDGTVCPAVVGMRKKCGMGNSFANVEVSEISWFSKTILTSNGGETVNQENIFDETGIENVVVHKEQDHLTFRVKNLNEKGSSWENDITMLPPLVKTVNAADDVVYPVLRGAGARKHDLVPNQYEDFRLEFNCISLEKDSEAVEVIFRPNFHTHYIFTVTKECEGLTFANWMRKEFQDSVVFDFFAFIFFTLIFFTIMMVALVIYAKYKEYQGEPINVDETSEYIKKGFQNL